MTRKYLLLAILLFGCGCLCAQTLELDLSSWDRKVIKKARRKSFHLFQTKRQRETVFYCNLARMNGELFVKTILKPYCEFTGKTKYTSYLQSLIDQLNHKKDIHPLRYSVWLSLMAKLHAVTSGKQGTIGHQNFKKRMWLTGVLRGDTGENCAYGPVTPLDNVIGLLIDEGVYDWGHRHNILEPRFRRVGVGFAKHKVYGINCVQEFSH